MDNRNGTRSPAPPRPASLSAALATLSGQMSGTLQPSSTSSRDLVRVGDVLEAAQEAFEPPFRP